MNLRVIRFTRPLVISSADSVLLGLEVFSMFKVEVSKIRNQVAFLINAILFRNVRAADRFLHVLNRKFLWIAADQECHASRDGKAYLAIIRVGVSYAAMRIKGSNERIRQRHVKAKRFLRAIKRLTRHLYPAKDKIDRRRRTRSRKAVRLNGNRNHMRKDLANNRQRI